MVEKRNGAAQARSRVEEVLREEEYENGRNCELGGIDMGSPRFVADNLLKSIPLLA